jgi:NAD-reducing hydrogenase large subunit
MLRKFGQEVIRITAGKRVHGTGSVPGGMNRAWMATEDATACAPNVPEVLAWAEAAVDLAERLHTGLPPRTWWALATRPRGHAVAGRPGRRAWSCTTARCACARPTAASSVDGFLSDQRYRESDRRRRSSPGPT